MINQIFRTLGGKSANEKRLDVISNNVANSLTPGFKATRAIFNIAPVGEPTNPGELQQTYVNIADSYVHFSDAPFVDSGNPLDLAIEGSGFFVISTPSGEMYTRNGQFTLDKDKKLVTMDGNAVVGQGGAEITIDGGNVEIGADGSIVVDGARADAIKIVDFTDKRTLRNFGNSLFVNLDDRNQPIAPSNSSVRQGAYEASNVDVVKEMVELAEPATAAAPADPETLAYVTFTSGTTQEVTAKFTNTTGASAANVTVSLSLWPRRPSTC